MTSPSLQAAFAAWFGERFHDGAPQGTAWLAWQAGVAWAHLPAAVAAAPQSSNLVSEMEDWIRDRGSIYACGRDYPGSWRPHDATCACCLIIAAVRALKSPAVETAVARTDHADNLAKALECYLSAHDILSGVQSSDDATGLNDASDGGFHDKANDAWRAMRTALHEYRKRRTVKTGDNA